MLWLSKVPRPAETVTINACRTTLLVEQSMQRCKQQLTCPHSVPRVGLRAFNILLIWSSQQPFEKGTIIISIFIDSLHFYRNFGKVFWLLVTAQWISIKLKTTNLYYVTVSVGQEFCGGLAVWLWLKVSHEVAVKISIWKLGAGGSTSKLSHMAVS